MVNAKGIIKYIKNILIIIVSLIVSVAFLFIMWEKEWKPLADMTELGYQELEPVAKATKPITLSDGHESTQYYVVTEVDTEEGLKKLYIEIEYAYGEEDLLKSLNYYRNKKKVAGYYYYSKEKSEVYFSKDVTTAQAYMESRAKIVVKIVVIANLCLIIVFVMVTALGTTRLPTIPGGNWTKEQLVVCRYNSFSYGILALMCLAFGGGLIFLTFYLLTSAEGGDSIMAGMMFDPLSLIFIAMGVLFILFMKNYALVLYPKGIVYRNAIGRTWFFTDEQVQYVSVVHAYRNHSFRIQTEEKNIWINYYCTNYNQAEHFVAEKYPDIETYKDNQR